MYNTGNPVPSAALEDMADNAKNFDGFVNSTENSFIDRLGVTRKTIAGMESEHDAQIAAHEVEHDNQMQSFETDFDNRLAGMAFTRVGSFTAGATLTDMRQVLVWEASQGGDGHEYGWTGSFSTSGKVVIAGSNPETSGGIGAGAWVDRTDLTFRSDLASESGSGLVGYQPAGTGAVATTVQSKLGETVSVFDFMTAAQIADVKAGTALLDTAEAIQAAIDYAIYLKNPPKPGTNVNQGAHVFLPAGIYRTTDTIHLGYGVNGFNQVIFEGEASYSHDQATTLSGIKPDFVDRPAINIQGGRRVCVRNLSITGKNLAWLAANYNSISDRSVVSNWYGPNISAANNTRYAPYAGITIDAYSGTQPATPYPAVNYPAWLGAVAQYNKNLSGTTTFENVSINGFVVGLAVAPYAGPFAGNGDFTTVRDCDFSFNIVGWSISNEDARNSNLFNSRIHFCHTSIDGETYGLQEGSAHLTAIGSSFDNVYRIFNVELDGGSATAQGAFGMSFSGCYSEALMSLGTAHSTSSGSTFRPMGINIANSKFAFTYRSTEYTPTLLLDAPGVDVYMDNVGLMGGFNFVQTNANLSARSVVISSVLDMIGNDTQAKRVAASYLCGLYAPNALEVRISPFLVYDFGGVNYPRATTIFDGARYSVPFYIPANQHLFRGAPIPWFTQCLKYGGATFPVGNTPSLPLNRATYNLTSLVKSTAHAKFKNDYTFTVSDVFVNNTYGTSIDNQFAVNAGDFAVDEATGHAFFVAGITYGADTITFRLRQLSGLRNAGTTGSPVWESTGTFAADTGVLRFYNARRFYPSYKRLVATMTSGANTITGAIVGSEVTSDADIIANLLYIAISTDDYIISSPKSEGINDSVFPYGKVLAKDSMTGVITLSQNARRSFYGDMPLFVKGAISGTAP